MGVFGPPIADDSDHLELGKMPASPVVEELGDCEVEPLIRHCYGLEDEVVDLAKCGRSNNVICGRWVTAPGSAPTHKHAPLGIRVVVPNAGEELNAGPVQEMPVSKHDCDTASFVPESRQALDGGRGGLLGNYFVVCRVAAGQRR